ncbi:MAG: helix-turn-helix domain-containing protein [Desulfatiglandaceae bacterium]
MGIPTSTPLAFWGAAGTLPIHPDDTVAKRLAMLIEGNCLGVRVDQAAQKYGLSRARYFQLQQAYREGGTEALKPKKKGPKKKSVRTDQVITQILRYRFLDPDASVAVLTQQLNQQGTRISQRSVERTITDYGLQKKTPHGKSGEGPWAD